MYRVCQFPIDVDAHIYQKHRFAKKWLGKDDTFARIANRITCIDGNVQIIDGMLLPSYLTISPHCQDADAMQIIRIVLTFSNMKTMTKLEQATTTDVQRNDLRAGFNEAKEIVGKKEVAMDKLGRSRRIVEILLAAGGAAAEVCWLSHDDTACDFNVFLA